jgi:hypothetical protein
MRFIQNHQRYGKKITFQDEGILMSPCMRDGNRM